MLSQIAPTGNRQNPTAVGISDVFPESTATSFETDLFFQPATTGPEIARSDNGRALHPSEKPPLRLLLGGRSSSSLRPLRRGGSHYQLTQSILSAAAAAKLNRQELLAWLLLATQSHRVNRIKLGGRELDHYLGFSRGRGARAIQSLKQKGWIKDFDSSGRWVVLSLDPRNPSDSFEQVSPGDVMTLARLTTGRAEALVVLALRIQDPHRNRALPVNQHSLADRLGLSPKTVRRALDKATASGFVAGQPGPREGGSRLWKSRTQPPDFPDTAAELRTQPPNSNAETTTDKGLQDSLEILDLKQKKERATSFFESEQTEANPQDQTAVNRGEADQLEKGSDRPTENSPNRQEKPSEEMKISEALEGPSSEANGVAPIDKQQSQPEGSSKGTEELSQGQRESLRKGPGKVPPGGAANQNAVTLSPQALQAKQMVLSRLRGARSAGANPSPALLDDCRKFGIDPNDPSPFDSAPPAQLMPITPQPVSLSVAKRDVTAWRSKPSPILRQRGLKHG